MSKNLDIYKEELGNRKVEDLTEYDFDFQEFFVYLPQQNKYGI